MWCELKAVRFCRCFVVTLLLCYIFAVFESLPSLEKRRVWELVPPGPTMTKKLQTSHMTSLIPGSIWQTFSQSVSGESALCTPALAHTCTKGPLHSGLNSHFVWVAASYLAPFPNTASLPDLILRPWFCPPSDTPRKPFPPEISSHIQSVFHLPRLQSFHLPQSLLALANGGNGCSGRQRWFRDRTCFALAHLHCTSTRMDLMAATPTPLSALQ